MLAVLMLLDDIDLDNLNLFELFNDNELIMKQTTFEYAIKRMGLKQSTVDSVRRVIVDGESRQKVIKETGINESHLSTTVTNIYKNLKKKCEEDGLILTSEFLISDRYKSALDTLEVLEAETLNELDKNSRRRKK